MPLISLLPTRNFRIFKSANGYWSLTVTLDNVEPLSDETISYDYFIDTTVDWKMCKDDSFWVSELAEVYNYNAAHIALIVLLLKFPVPHQDDFPMPG